MPPETTETEKRISTLTSELSRLKASEPVFSLVTPSDDKFYKLELRWTRHLPLNDIQIREFLARIEKQFPLETDFGDAKESSQNLEVPFFGAIGLKQYYVPASAREIAAYRNDKYPGWLKDCENLLRTYHARQQQRTGLPSFAIELVNTGTRPAKNVLITFEAKGNFSIKQPLEKSVKGSPDQSLKFPNPPIPPRGQWLDPLQRSLASLDFTRHQGFSTPLYERPHLGSLRPEPDTFYYRDRTSFPTDAFSLECQQWRHGISPERFTGDIVVDAEQHEIHGAIECTIHAENLSDRFVVAIPLSVSVNETHASFEAERRLQFLLAGMNNLSSDA